MSGRRTTPTSPNYYPGDNGDYVFSDQLGGDLLGVNGTGNVFTDLNIIFIDTDGADFKFTNTNFILDGAQDQDFIFLVNDGANFLINNSELLLGPQMDWFSSLWFLGDDSTQTINFSQSESLGMAFWNNSPDGVILANNYRACGQWVAENIQDWNDFSVDRCSYSAEVIPLPATLPMLVSVLAFGAFVARRRTRG